MNLQTLRQELVRDEGKLLAAYKDTNGWFTIGVGHLLGAHARMTQITEPECGALLDLDIRVACESAEKVLPGTMDLDMIEAARGDLDGDIRQRAIVNMVFNRGLQRMMDSTTITPAIRKGITSGDWRGIKDLCVNSQWGSQVGARAVRLGHMLEFGETL